MDSTQQSASSIIKATLDQYGLGSLGDWAWQKYLTVGNTDQVFLELRQQPQYTQRFPAMAALAAKGQAISEAQYISYETNVQQLLHSYGIPNGIYDTPEAIGKMLTNDVSASEVNHRLSLAAQAAFQSPPEVRDALHQQYGVSPGGLTAFWLDPDKAMPVLQKELTAAQVQAYSQKNNAALSAAQSSDLAQTLAEQGYDPTNPAALQQGMAAAGTLSSLQQGVGSTVDSDTLVRAQFGDAAAQAAVQNAQKGRAAAFSGGGGAADSAQQGVVGLGSAGRR